jgi:hypothetical protein
VSAYDIGAFFPECHAAGRQSRGWGTIPAITLVHYPQVLRDHLGIPTSQNVVIGIAIGYTDDNHGINRFRSAEGP